MLSQLNGVNCQLKWRFLAIKPRCESQYVMAEKRQPEQSDPKPESPRVSWWPVVFTAILAYLLGTFLLDGYFSAKQISWLEFKKIYQADDVAKLKVINGQTVEVFLKEASLAKDQYREIENRPAPHYEFTIGSVENFENKLQQTQEEFGFSEELDIQYESRTNWWMAIMAWVVPLLILVALFHFLTRRIKLPTGTNPFDFGKSRAKEFDESAPAQPKFSDVAGHESAKQEIMEIVDFLKHPEMYTKLGAKIPKGIMLVGPPGTGKTLMARAVAGEADVPFFSISGSEFVELFVGVGASRVRDLFRKAKEKAPSIIFIDEIDAVGRSRGGAFSLQSNDERESTLNQLLTEMDGFGENTGVIVMAATNRPDILDKALLRPGRFDRHIYLELPNMTEREAIFEVHTKRLKLCHDLPLSQLAKQTPGFSGADIANICNEAALIAARQKSDCIDLNHFREAIDRTIGGLERSKILSPAEKRRIAYHESGHALVSWFLEDAEELVKVSIVPRGKSLGAAWYQPEEHAILTQSQLMAGLITALGGRAAEDLVLKEISSGALDDLEKVTKQAYMMVAYYGISERVRNLSYYDSSGRNEQSLQKPYSEATGRIIDEEVKKLVDQAYGEATRILTEHRPALENLADELYHKEVLLQDDLERILGKRVGRDGSSEIALQVSEKDVS